MSRKHSSIVTHNVAIDRELDTTGYDVVKAVSDNLVPIGIVADNINAMINASSLAGQVSDDTTNASNSASAALASQQEAAVDAAQVSTDLAATTASAAAASANATSTGADKIAVAADKIVVGNNLASTNQDTIDTAADLAACIINKTNAASYAVDASAAAASAQAFSSVGFGGAAGWDLGLISETAIVFPTDLGEIA